MDKISQKGRKNIYSEKVRDFPAFFERKSRFIRKNIAGGSRQAAPSTSAVDGLLLHFYFQLPFSICIRMSARLYVCVYIRSDFYLFFAR